jgi:cyanophycin synthetase
VPELLRDALLANGVEAERITIVPGEEDAVAAALDMAAAGDQLLIFGDNVQRCWKQIIYYNRDPEAADAEAAQPVAVYTPLPADVPAVEMAAVEGAKMIRDERGVRLAREPEDAD